MYLLESKITHKDLDTCCLRVCLVGNMKNNKIKKMIVIVRFGSYYYLIVRGK